MTVPGQIPPVLLWSYTFCIRKWCEKDLSTIFVHFTRDETWSFFFRKTLYKDWHWSMRTRRSYEYDSYGTLLYFPSNIPVLPLGSLLEFRQLVGLTSQQPY